MIRTVAAAIFAFTLSSSLDAQAQQPDISGKHSIRASGKTKGQGDGLHIWTFGKVVADKRYSEKTTFEIIKVGDDTRKGKEAGLYHLRQQDGYYLTVIDGKVIGSKVKPSKDTNRWIL